MNSFAALMWKELLILGRDRHGLAVLFLMPAIFILIMSLALRDAMSPGQRVALPYLFLDEDGGYFALTLADALSEQQTLVKRPAANEADLLEQLRTDQALFAVHIGKDFQQRIAQAGVIEKDLKSPALAPGAAAGVIEKDLRSPALAPGAAAGADVQRQPLLRVYLSPTAPPQSRLLFLAQLRAALARVQAEYLLEDQMGVPHEEARKLRAQSDPANLPIEEIYVGAQPGAIAPNAVQQSVPAWLVFAMFFVVLPLATSVLAEREQGNLQRLALLNVSPARLLAAKFPAYYLVNLVQLALMLAVGIYLVPLLGGERLTLGNSPLGLWLIASALSISAIGFALLIAVIAHSAVQATTLGGIANLIFGAIGGVMVPKLVMPPVMQSASMMSPMSWALEGCWDILLRNGGVADVLPETAALLAFGFICYCAATFFFPKYNS